MQFQSLTQLFAADQKSLLEALDNFEQLVPVDVVGAKEFFKQVKFGLQRRIAWEERITFPAFQRNTPTHDARFTVTMSQEHRELESALELLHAKVQRKDAACLNEVKTLRVMLIEHGKNEVLFYSALDGVLNSEDRQDVINQCARLPENIYRTCCCHVHV